MPQHFTAGYMDDPFDIERHADAARHHMRGIDYDTLVGTGLSGALVVPGLARALGKYALLVRKPGDGSHACNTPEGTLGDRWVFVDDFVSSGATRKRVLERITALGAGAEFVGTFCYARDLMGDGPKFEPASFMALDRLDPDDPRSAQEQVLTVNEASARLDRTIAQTRADLLATPVLGFD